MAEPQTERSERLAKLTTYQAVHGTAFPAQSQRSHTIAQVLKDFKQLTNQAVTLVGRIRLWREHGKLTFAQIEDQSGKIQVALSQQELGADGYHELGLYDVGDIIQITGTPFITKAGEQSVLVQNIHLLTKALLPLPNKWQGIQDEELRFRKRYLDILFHPELRDMFIKKAKFWNGIRQFLVKRDFLEVETPVLEATPGGADAQPFITHHQALDIDLYLRISMGELWQKRLMVAGFEKTFEIGRQFRNEGISPEHLQDYTQMEFYWAYADYTQTMSLVEDMYKTVIADTFGTLQFSIHGFAINFDQAWPRLDYTAEVKRQTQVDLTTATTAELLAACERLGITVAPDQQHSVSRLTDLLWKYCRKTIAGPVFIINHPIAVSPLAKRKADQPNVVERYQVIIAGSELGNGYSELNDPIDQQQRFEQQAQLREAGDSEAQMHDHEFVEALEHGMPPTSGFGVSERLFSFLMDKPIRECVLFPLLRPKTVSASTASVATQQQADITTQPFAAGISRADALQWMQQEVQDRNLRRHMLATEALMQALARHFNVPAVEAWGLAGLLHDIDWDKTPIEQHSLVGADMLAEKQIHPAIVAAVREHNYHHGLGPTTLLSKALMSLEQLTGFIIAIAFVRPDRSLAGITLQSVKKKLKDKAFARGVDRTMLSQAEALTGIPLDEAIMLCLQAMQTIEHDLDIK